MRSYKLLCTSVGFITTLIRTCCDTWKSKDWNGNAFCREFPFFSNIIQIQTVQIILKIFFKNVT